MNKSIKMFEKCTHSTVFSARSLFLQVLQFPVLQRLSLAMLPEISDEGVVSVAFHCPCLTSLTLSGCSRLTDAGLARALPRLHRLQHLHLAYCDSITDR